MIDIIFLIFILIFILIIVLIITQIKKRSSSSTTGKSICDGTWTIQFTKFQPIIPLMCAKISETSCDLKSNDDGIGFNLNINDIMNLPETLILKNIPFSTMYKDYWSSMQIKTFSLNKMLGAYTSGDILLTYPF